MEKAGFKNIIFDFDGTLVDSRPGIVKTFKKVAKELVLKELKEQEIAELIGKPLAQIISIILKTEDNVFIEKGCDLFKEYYNKDGVYQNIVYPGIKEMIRSFKNSSFCLFIVSNKIESFIKKILEQHDLKEYFTAVSGTDGSDIKSKKSEQINNIIICRGLKKDETAIVGDTENDIIAAKENFIYSIGITWGYGSKESLIKAGADSIFQDPKKLEQFIKKE